MIALTAKDVLPQDGTAGTLIGRVWLPEAGGPAVAAVRGDGVFDVSASFSTVSALCEADDPAAALQATKGMRIGDLDSILANTPPDRRDRAKPWLLAPLDLQVLKAAGVTFAISMLERVIEERARGNPASAEAIRKEVVQLVGDDFSKLKPGSPQAMKLKQVQPAHQARRCGAVLAEALWDAGIPRDLLALVAIEEGDARLTIGLSCYGAYSTPMRSSTSVTPAADQAAATA